MKGRTEIKGSSCQEQVLMHCQKDFLMGGSWQVMSSLSQEVFKHDLDSSAV